LTPVADLKQDSEGRQKPDPQGVPEQSGGIPAYRQSQVTVVPERIGFSVAKQLAV